MFSRKSSQDPHRGFGYVEFSLAEDALEAIDNMDQAELYGRVIKVNQAKPQKQAGEKLGSKTAIWEQVSLPGRSMQWREIGRLTFDTYRKTTRPSTMSAKRTGWLSRMVPTSLWIPCKVSKVWIKLVPSSTEWASLFLYISALLGFHWITLFQRGVQDWGCWQFECKI